MLCGARNRAGGRCQRVRMIGRPRCWMHGGKKNSGNRTNWSVGLRAAAVGYRRYVEMRRALGLPGNTGGRPSGARWKRARDDRERALVVIENELSKLPAPPGGPVEQWSTPQLFNDDLRLSLLRQHQVLSQDMKEVSDPKERRLIIDCSGQVMRAAVRLREADLRDPPNDKGWDELLARLAEAQKKSGRAGGDIIDAKAVPVTK